MESKLRCFESPDDNFSKNSKTVFTRRGGGGGESEIKVTRATIVPFKGKTSRFCTTQRMHLK